MNKKIKFSVLLPTRNRLEYLKFAIRSIQSQDYTDWELIISDNASEENIKGYINELSDQRIIYQRLDTPVPVTENWNNSLKYATGDYFIMLGDDDALLDGYFTKMLKIISSYNNPDLIFHDAIQFHYPKILSSHTEAKLMEPYHEFFLKDKHTHRLDRSYARSLVISSMKFKLRYNYNMQYALVSSNIRKTLEEHGDFFQSPYPDYYAMNSLFLIASNIVVHPEKLVVIGVTPKSFGYYYLNDKQKEGTLILTSGSTDPMKDSLKDIIIAGSDLFTSWLIAMEYIKRNFHNEKLKISYVRYRILQIIDICRKTAQNQNTLASWRNFIKKITFIEKFLFFPFLIGVRIGIFKKTTLFCLNVLDSKLTPYPIYDAKVKNLPDILNMDDFIKAVQSGKVVLS